MKTLILFIAAALPASSTFAQSPSATAKETKTATAQPSEAELMKQMMQFARPGENHRLLADLEGSRTFVAKMWNPADPSAAPTQSSGSAVRNEAMGGRYYVGQFSGVVQMPGSDGKMKDMEFRGMSIEGYDNVKKIFLSAWIDNMGPAILNSEGTYDAAKKAFTYKAESEPIPGMKCKIREVVTGADSDHHVLEWYEDRGAGEAKTMEINYTRRKK